MPPLSPFTGHYICHVPHLSEPHTSQRVHTVDNDFVAIVVEITVNNRLMPWDSVFSHPVRLLLRSIGIS